MVHLRHTVTPSLYNIRLCEDWMGNQLDEDSNEASQPIGCHVPAAMTDIVLVPIEEIAMPLS